MKCISSALTRRDSIATLSFTSPVDENYATSAQQSSDTYHRGSVQYQNIRGCEIPVKPWRAPSVEVAHSFSYGLGDGYDFLHREGLLCVADLAKKA